MTHAVSYMRCSGDSQISGDTWDRQSEKIHDLADRHDFQIEKEWREEGISGKIDCEQRPAFQAMLSELLANGCRTIIVEDLSRLARRYAVQEQILLYLCAKEITLWTCANGGQNITEEMNQDPTKRLVIGIIGLVSQWEREQIVAKLRAAKDRMRARGEKAEGRYAYGFHPEKQEEKEVLDSILDRARQGYSADKIAMLLNVDKVPTRTGKGPWYSTVVRRILARETNPTPEPV